MVKKRPRELQAKLESMAWMLETGLAQKGLTRPEVRGSALPRRTAAEGIRQISGEWIHGDSGGGKMNLEALLQRCCAEVEFVHDSSRFIM